MLSTSGACALHLDRRGVGVCVECRRVVCAECTTRFEGINRCTACLARRRDELAQQRGLPEWTVLNVLVSASGLSMLALVIHFILRAVFDAPSE